MIATHGKNLPLLFIPLLFITIKGQSDEKIIPEYKQKYLRSTKPFNPITQHATLFTGTQAYMAARGNNVFSGSFDYLLTLSLNNNTGILTNKQQLLTEAFSITTPSPLNISPVLQHLLPTSSYTESIAQIQWVVVNGIAYLATRGYITNLGTYIAIYTLDTSTGGLINRQQIIFPQTKPISDIQWTVVNNEAFLAAWGLDTQYSRYFIDLYVLNTTDGSLTNTEKILLLQAETINQSSWTVVNNKAYLATWGLDANTNKYFIAIYTLDTTSGSFAQQRKTPFQSTDSITQIEWIVLNNDAYLAVNGYNISSNRPFINLITLNQTIGTLGSQQKTLLLQTESCNQIAWISVNGNAYLGIWGLDSQQNQYYISTFALNTTQGSLINKQKTFTLFGEMINFISWTVLNGTAYLAAPGFDNFRNRAFIAVYILNESNGRLINPQFTFFEIQESINQIEWVISNAKAYLGIRGYDSLNNKFYLSTFTLNTTNGRLFNRNKRLASSGEALYQLAWVAI